MVLSWRRQPVGAGLSLIRDRAQRQLAGYGRGVLKLSEEEFEEGLREGSASEAMIERELKQFRELKAAQEAAKPVKTAADRRRERRERQLEDPGLDPYVEAEIRRTGGVAADEIIDGLREDG